MESGIGSAGEAGAVAAGAIEGPGPRSFSGDMGPTSAPGFEGPALGIAATPVSAIDTALPGFGIMDGDPGELDFGGVRNTRSTLSPQDIFTLPHMNVTNFDSPELNIRVGLDTPTLPASDVTEAQTDTVPQINSPTYDFDSLIPDLVREDLTLSPITLAELRDLSPIIVPKPHIMDNSLYVPIISKDKYEPGIIFTEALHPVEPQIDVPHFPEPEAPLVDQPDLNNEPMLLQDLLPEEDDEQAIGCVRAELQALTQPLGTIEMNTDVQDTILSVELPITQPQLATTRETEVSNAEQEQSATNLESDLSSDAQNQATDTQPASMPSPSNTTDSPPIKQEDPQDFILAIPEIEARKQLVTEKLIVIIKDREDTMTEEISIPGSEVIEGLEDSDPGKSPILPDSQEDPTWGDNLEAVAGRTFSTKPDIVHNSIEVDAYDHPSIDLGKGTKATKEEVQRVFEKPEVSTTLKSEGVIFIEGYKTKNTYSRDNTHLMQDARLETEDYNAPIDLPQAA